MTSVGGNRSYHNAAMVSRPFSIAIHRSPGHPRWTRTSGNRDGDVTGFRYNKSDRITRAGQDGREMMESENNSANYSRSRQRGQRRWNYTGWQITRRRTRE